MLSVNDAEALSIPLGLFASKDESKDEVRNLCSRIGRCISLAFASQFDKIVNVLSQKPFAAKVDSKYYSNMFVMHLTIAPEAYALPPGPTVGLLPAEISRILRKRGSTRTSTPGLLLSSRMRSLETSFETNHV